jgi:5-methylcytosine-specific restriction endonuclease McrA
LFQNKKVEIVKCSNCSKKFEKTKNQLDKWERRKNENHFCCKNCYEGFRKKIKHRLHDVKCSICGNIFSKAGIYHGKSFYCPNCRGKITIKCDYCNKKFERFKSAIRFKGGVSHLERTKVFCSSECKNIGTRKPWAKTSRAGIKIKWIREFGIETLYCRRCGYKKSYNIELHHKIYVINGGEHVPENLEPLCRNCHGEEHFEHVKDKNER